ncbi:MAG TPA: carboxypeptidase-like regulatory domain-containing protein [Blastocatellia bacterium]|nr:carboxypeptidase-like regulatory domain-containing protein [Blastocatellia bacterium]
MKTRMFLALALLILIPALPASAQSDRGSITGTVTDPSGAAVSGVKVTATNLDTGEVRETVSNDEGNYTLAELKAGPYKLTVEGQGFKSSTFENIQVAVQVTRRADVTLEVGNVSDVVTVTSDAPVIQVESAVRQTNITERQVRELPLSVSAETAGRTPLSFIFLDSNVTAGTGSTGRGTDASNFRVSGGQGLGTEILIDGASTRRAQNGTFFTEVAPGPNAFQEFTLSTSTYSAEFGNSTGGIVNFTIKSGTNELHGELYDYFRNEALNANSFFKNAQTDPEVARKDLDRQNNFGASIGGPVYIPKLYDGRNRTFFFFNYEGYRFTLGETRELSVPTLRMRTGDFSELLTDPAVIQQFGRGVQIYDPTESPATRTAIPNNRLDLYRGGAIIDRVGLAILQRFPEPTRPGVFRNYVSNSTNPIDMNSYVTKIDQVITDNQRLNVSYSFRKQEGIKGGFTRFPEPFVTQDVWDQAFRSHYVRLQHDFSFSPTLLNHFNAGVSRILVTNRNFTEGFDPAAELGLNPLATQNAAFPRVGFPGYGDTANPVGDVRSYQNIGSTFFSDRLADNSLQLSDFVTWVKGRHTLKFGGNLQWQQFNVHQLIDPGGTFNFRHDQTAADRDPDGGWPIASLITGATEFSFVNFKSIDPGWRYFTPGFFVNDDFKVTPRLTLNLGIRYDIPYPRTEYLDRFRGFDPNAINPVVNRPGAIVGAAGQGGLQAENEGLIETDYSNISPRFGFAYSLDNRTVVRGGFGLYYAPLLYGFNGSNSIAEGTLGYSTGALRTPAGRQSLIFLDSLPNRPEPDPNGQFIGATDIDFFDPNFKTGRTAQWSLDVQRELAANFAVSVGYIGSKGTRLKSNFTRLNALPLDALKLGFPLLVKPLRDVTPQERAYAASVGAPLPSSPDAVFAGFNGTVAESLRPFPQYGRINNLLESQGQSWYNALQVKLDRRFAQGVQFGFSYTFSKLLTNAAEDLFGGSPIGGVLQNPYDRRSLKTVSANNAPHVLVFNYIFELPFGRGRRFLDQGGWVDRVVGGWQIGGIHRYQSGLPVTVFTSENRDFLDVVGFGGNLRLNLTGRPLLPGTSPNGLRFLALNPAAFSAPPNFQAPPTGDVTSAAYRAYYADPLRFFGDAPPVLEDARLLAFRNEDLSILKKTRVTETVTVEFRAEFFNLFNRVRYFFPDPDFRNLNIFGFSNVINNDLSRPRSIQLGLKVIF